MPNQLPAITGMQLIHLLEDAEWISGRKTLHGIAFRKRGPDGRSRVTTVPKKKAPIPNGTLSAILGPKQTGIGRDGLAELIAQFGLR